ncbi:hypothetical protein [Estrella lausannensis]|uniref:Uncharacterized protein n=1 Tax=Estrella lausannensis TaxID=483423 RepID=A0A0H5DQ21_9BACT|nr:hypothetical protein [Estrella lausannensis]CRX38572.1 hypothetical protein ELAC_1231 [Estrella lausannensis]
MQPIKTMPKTRRREVESMLKTHLPAKVANRDWISQCLRGRKACFPYIASEKEAGVAREIFEPASQSALNPLIPDDNLPLYLINVPMAHRPEEEGYDQFNRLIQLYKDESFGKTKTASREEIKARFSLVLGVNQIKSMDPEVNEKFRDWVSNIPLIKGVAYRIFGFFWVPGWERKGEAHRLTYPAPKAFFILKMLSTTKAGDVRTYLEGGKGKLTEGLIAQIPYQRIREKIKDSDFTKHFVKEYAGKGGESPVYLGVMDADTLNLKRKIGLFTRLDKTIENHDTPSAVTHGYRVIEPERPLIELGVRLDMACRAAMNRAISYGAYFPEPCSLFCIKRPKEKVFIDELTFIGAGRGLENRRLIESGIASKVLKHDAVFVADGGVATTTPARMKTIKNGQVTQLTKTNVKQKANLQALRSVSQTHIHPKQWADNLYIALPFKASRVTDATGPMMHIFSVFDPLSRMFAQPARFSAAVVDKVLKNYDADLTKDQKAILKEAREDLVKLKMKSGMIDQIEEAARLSGAAITRILKEVMGIE